MAEHALTHLPALKAKFGDRLYYVTILTFKQVANLIKPAREVHKSRRLSQWIQRVLLEEHADSIAEYLGDSPDRFFSSIVCGVYGGVPNWSPLRPRERPGDASPLGEVTLDSLERSVGILTLSGGERLFAIDGQHRVEGIRRALARGICPEDEELSVLFVGHSLERPERTRRLFVTLNRRARRVGEANRIALDEDDGFAIVTRRLVDDEPVIPEKLIGLKASAALSDGDASFTNIITLYNAARDLFPGATDLKDRPRFADSRPSDVDVDKMYDEVVRFWRLVRKHVPEVEAVISGNARAPEYRRPENNHLLLRPVGQRALASSVRVLVDRDGWKLTEAVKKLCSLDLWIHGKRWSHIAWDPIAAKMKSSATLVETALLAMVKAKARTPRAEEKYREVLKARGL